MNEAFPVVYINGVPTPWREGLSVAKALEERGVTHAAHDTQDAMATALNSRFVPRGARADTPLAPGDALAVFHAIVGG